MCMFNVHIAIGREMYVFMSIGGNENLSESQLNQCRREIGDYFIGQLKMFVFFQTKFDFDDINKVESDMLMIWFFLIRFLSVWTSSWISFRIFDAIWTSKRTTTCCWHSTRTQMLFDWHRKCSHFVCSLETSLFHLRCHSSRWRVC